MKRRRVLITTRGCKILKQKCTNKKQVFCIPLSQVSLKLNFCKHKMFLKLEQLKPTPSYTEVYIHKEVLYYRSSNLYICRANLLVESQK